MKVITASKMGKSCCLFLADRRISMITLSDSSQNLTQVFGSQKGQIQSCTLLFVKTGNESLKGRILKWTKIKYFHRLHHFISRYGSHCRWSFFYLAQRTKAYYFCIENVRPYLYAQIHDGCTVPQCSPLVDNRHCTIR